MEPEGDFLVEPDCILGRREIRLWNRTIGQVKVQWKHLSLDKATWELESHMQETSRSVPGRLRRNLSNIEDDVELKRGCL